MGISTQRERDKGHGPRRLKFESNGGEIAAREPTAQQLNCQFEWSVLHLRNRRYTMYVDGFLGLLWQVMTGLEMRDPLWYCICHGSVPWFLLLGLPCSCQRCFRRLRSMDDIETQEAQSTRSTHASLGRAAWSPVRPVLHSGNEADGATTCTNSAKPRKGAAIPNSRIITWWELL